jgi:hypothetical protein
MQRLVWAEQEGDDLRMRKSHAASPESLDEIWQMFERSKGRYPAEEVKEARRRQELRSKGFVLLAAARFTFYLILSIERV